MTSRERFLASFNYQPVDFIFDREFGYWEATWERWHNEGLPQGLASHLGVEEHFGFEQLHGGGPGLGLSTHFEEEIIEEGDNWRIWRNSGGVLQKSTKDGTSIPQFLDYPVKDRKTWEEFRERYDADDPNHYPSDWDQKVEQWKNRDFPLAIGCGGFYGWARDIMGVENLSVAVMLDKELIRDMFLWKTDFALKILEKAISQVDYDVSTWWEDMCFNHGPLISPALFDELMVPCYKRIVDELEVHGVKLHMVDCDGNIYQLAPLWFKAGVNLMFPIEAHWTDPVELRKRHGKEMLLSGGVDKRALIEGPEAIDRELERLKPLVEEGGFVPHVDHRVPPDVSLENYKYYVQAKHRLIGRGED